MNIINLLPNPFRLLRVQTSEVWISEDPVYFHFTAAISLRTKRLFQVRTQCCCIKRVNLYIDYNIPLSPAILHLWILQYAF